LSPRNRTIPFLDRDSWRAAAVFSTSVSFTMLPSGGPLL
jgi:hypothetical protein